MMACLVEDWARARLVCVVEFFFLRSLSVAVLGPGEPGACAKKMSVLSGQCCLMTSKPVRVSTRAQYGVMKGRPTQDWAARLEAHMHRGHLGGSGCSGCSLEMLGPFEDCVCTGRGGTWRCGAASSSSTDSSVLPSSSGGGFDNREREGEGESESEGDPGSDDGVPKWLFDVGFGRDEALKILKRSPHAGRLASMVDVQASIMALRGEGVSRRQLQQLIRRDPLVLKKLDKLQEYWELYSHYGVDSKAEFYFAIEKYPKMLTYSPKNNIQPSLEFLERCGLSKEGAKKMLLRCPSLLWISVEDSFKPFIEHFKSMGATKQDIARYISSNPFLLRHTIGGRMEGASHYLSSLGLTRKEIIKAFLTYPQIAGYSTENMMKPVATFFKEQGASDQVIQTMVRMHPNILGLSLPNNIRPKYQVVTDILGRSPDEFFSLPSLLTRSLDKRILFRLAFLLQEKSPVEDMSLTQMFMPTNKFFESKYGEKNVLQFMDDWAKLTMEEKYLICRRGCRARGIYPQGTSIV